MINYPHVNPIALQLGPLAIRWYGLCYVMAFALIFFLARRQILKKEMDWTLEQFIDLLTFGMVGVLVGGRLGYMLFYQLGAWWQNPFLIFQVWTGGMSFHGGLLGVIVALAGYAHWSRRSFWDIMDTVAPWAPIGLAFGRLGNFINGELWGRVTDVPWGMIFPLAGPEVRHPSQLYECLGEGLLLGALLQIYRRAFLPGKPPAQSLSGLFLLGYGMVRFGVEFFREPDRPWGFIWADWLTMGQALSMPMIGFGLYLLWNSMRQETQT